MLFLYDPFLKSGFSLGGSSLYHLAAVTPLEILTSGEIIRKSGECYKFERWEGSVSRHKVYIVLSMNDDMLRC
jgi:hypothetical protein